MMLNKHEQEILTTLLTIQIEILNVISQYELNNSLKASVRSFGMIWKIVDIMLIDFYFEKSVLSWDCL